ncbi:MAG TPA: fumarylacetoacetate hydrolase family protein [Acidimicrobiales bacterium]|jgi:acylpyruvate hydrolase|nr:fumarylacetoacetate hydrolase family protein [Acidimicrobiales bacterium]
MRLATIRDGGRTRAVRADGGEAVELPAADVREVLDREGWHDWAAAADGPRRPLADLDFAPLIPSPDKILCVGLNYRSHIQETGREPPEFPTLFAKFRSALIGANDDIMLPAASGKVDWEAELAVIVGTRARHVSLADAPGIIAGYAVLNDVSMRDWQNRTLQWLQGKTWEHSTPLGPWLVTADESPGPSREIACEVDGEQMQKADTADMVFDPATLVSYISTVLTLEPGDVIATGTPSGVGAGRGRFLAEGNVVVTRIAGLGEQRNVCRREATG